MPSKLPRNKSVKTDSATATARHHRSSPSPRQHSAAAWLWPSIILVSVLISYSNTLRVPFFFDDLESIPDNPTIRSLRTSWFPRSSATVTGRPLLNFTFALNYMFGGLQVVGYHIVNILIHIINGCLLFGLVRRTLAMPRLETRFSQESARWIAGVSAVLWVLHPLATEGVTYTVQRSESLSAMWILASVLLFAVSVRAIRPAVWLIASVIAALLGVLTKETAAVLPVLLLIYDWLLVSDGAGALLKKRAAYYIGLCLTWLVMVPVIMAGRHGTAGFGLDVSPLQYAATQTGVIAHYLRLAIIPYPLIIDYGWPIVKSIPQFPLTGIVTIACLGLSAYALLRRKPAALAGAWFFLLLAPSSSFVPIVTEVAAERRMYLPLAGLVAAAVASGVLWLKSRKAASSSAIPEVCWVMSVIAGVMFCILTVRRNAQYADPIGLWREAATHYPNNARAHYNLALNLETAGKLEPALQGYMKTIEKDSSKIEAYTNAALLLSRTGRTSEALALSHRAREVRPDFAPVYANLGMILSGTGDTTGALQQYELALQKEPAYADGHYNAANALSSLGRLPEAETHYREAVRLKPEFAAALSNLGISLLHQGRVSDAEKEFRKALALRPDLASAHFNLGLILMQTGRRPDARSELQLALKYNPNLQPARAALQDLEARPN